jgi:hypothetical protein
MAWKWTRAFPMSLVGCVLLSYRLWTRKIIHISRKKDLSEMNIDDISCPECSLNPLLSKSEQQSLEFHSTFSLLDHSLGLSMFSTPSIAYRVLLVVPASFLNWVLGFFFCLRMDYTHLLSPFQGFWSNSIHLNRFSRFKTRVNSNINLLQLWFVLAVIPIHWVYYFQLIA